MSNATREAKLRAALVSALERLPSHAEVADEALVIAKVLRLHLRENALPALVLARAALLAVSVREAREADERRGR